MGGFMRHFVLVTSLLLVSFAAFAQTYSNASLNGSYTLQFSQTQYDTWSKTARCTYNGKTYTATGIGNTVSTKNSTGVIVFDGVGSITATGMEAGIFDQTLSDATVIITFNSQCVATINNGHAVFDPPASISGTGTYEVQSNGSGTVTFSGNGGGVWNFELAGTTAANISNTALLYSFSTGVPNEVNGTGMAVRQLVSE
jgi:hypothetical protein